jgi:predicted DsbA family dithiol-disulfide isomerase
MPKKLAIDVWSDIVCPWCMIGKRRLELALAKVAHEKDVAVTWRAFELDRGAPAVPAVDDPTRIAQKYGRTRAEMLTMMQRVEQTAAQDGLELHLATARSGNTFDAHRVLKLAGERGAQGAVQQRLLRGHFTENALISDRAVLVRLASEAGLDADEVSAVLASDRYADAVREDERTAQSLGISGVPFFLFAGKYAVSGAQPVPVMLRTLEQAWASLPEGEGAEDGEDVRDGAACGPEGCA